MASFATFAFLLSSLAQGAQEPLPLLEADRITNAEHLARRKAVLAWMPPNSVAVLTTNPDRNRSNDTSFRFRPESNFWYLTGFPEPDAALVLAPSGLVVDGKKVTEVLLVNDRNAAEETWTGFRFGPASAQTRLGIEAVVSNRRLGEILAATGPGPYVRPVRVVEPTGSIAQMQTAVADWAKGRETVNGLAAQLGKQRAIKSTAEIALLRKAVNASVNGHLEAIKSCEPNMREFDLQATVEYCFARGGCEAVGYNSIVGAGPDSCVLHYESNRRTMRDGEIICMDVAGEYHGYSADVTRSFPVNGKFSPAQREIYNLVLEAQNAGIAACTVGASFGASHQAAQGVIAAGLKRLGIIKNENEVGRYFMHGTSHTIGLDVHDTGIRTLEANVAMTVEPGIYIAANSPCDPKYWNIGVRIEDDILVTANGPENMSAGVPRTIPEIEALMKQKGLANVAFGKKP